MLRENTHRQNAQDIIDHASDAINSLKQYNSTLHKLEEHFLSEAEVKIISYGDVRDTIDRLVQIKALLENAIPPYGEKLASDGHK